MRVLKSAIGVVVCVCIWLVSTHVAAQEEEKPTWSSVGTMLSSADVNDRRQAAWFIAVTKPLDQSIEFSLTLIKRTLRDEDAKVRGLGVAALQATAWLHATNQMEQTGEDPARLAAAENDEELFELVLRAVRDKEAVINNDEPARREAITALGWLYWYKEEVPAVLVQLYEEDEDPLIRKSIIEVIRLGKLDTESTNKVLIDAISSSNPVVKQSAASAIERARAKDAIPALLNSYITTDEPHLRQSMLSAIRAFLDDDDVNLTERIRKQHDELRTKLTRAEELMTFMSDPSHYPKSVDPRYQNQRPQTGNNP